MSLPNLGIPKYQIIIPSTKKVTSFRPFLVKEQKVLYMALESQDDKQVLGAMCNIIKACVDNIPNPETMPIFDLEYMFTKIRSKSVGEIIDLKSKCPQCEKYNDIAVNLEEVEVQFPPNISNKIMLTEKVGLVLRYPRITDVQIDMTTMNVEEVLKFIISSVESVFDEDNVYTRKDFNEEEITKFVESMTNTQFELIGKFYLNMPQLKKDVQCKCLSCGNEFQASFRGLQDFFT